MLLAFQKVKYSNKSQDMFVLGEYMCESAFSSSRLDKKYPQGLRRFDKGSEAHTEERSISATWLSTSRF